MKPLQIIAACSENRVIGRQGRIPWHIPDDLGYAGERIKGGVVIEGRRCYEERGKPLPGCETIVLTRQKNWNAKGVHVAHSLEDARNLAESLPGRVWIGGGEGLYRDALPIAEQLYLTLVQTVVPDGDRFFPDWRDEFTREVYREASSDERHCFTFLVFERN